MDQLPSATSSVYSSSFPLDDLLHRLSEQTKDQEEHTIYALLEEREQLTEELRCLRRCWDSLYQLIVASDETARGLSFKMDKARKRIKQEENKWFANLTAI